MVDPIISNIIRLTQGEGRGREAPNAILNRNVLIPGLTFDISVCVWTGEFA